MPGFLQGLRAGRRVGTPGHTWDISFVVSLSLRATWTPPLSSAPALAVLLLRSCSLPPAGPADTPPMPSLPTGQPPGAPCCQPSALARAGMATLARPPQTAVPPQSRPLPSRRARTLPFFCPEGRSFLNSSPGSHPSAPAVPCTSLCAGAHESAALVFARSGQGQVSQGHQGLEPSEWRPAAADFGFGFSGARGRLCR